MKWTRQAYYHRPSMYCQKAMDGSCPKKSQRSRRMCRKSPSSWAHELILFSSNLCPSMLTKVGNVFDWKIRAGNSLYRHSILREALPVILGNPPYLHAYIACITMTDMNAAPYWRERAMLHYSHALNGLINAITSHIGVGARWKRACAMLLHLYEVR